MIRRLFLLIVLLVLATGGVGIWRGWFTASTNQNGNGPGVTVGVDKDKIAADEQKVKDAVQAKVDQGINKVKEEAKDAAGK